MGPDGKPRIAFLAHRLGDDHSEGISMIDMNGDGFVDLLSGAYWYENPGANGGEWKRHQFRTVGTHNEFVNDCGEWAIDVDHDGLPDLVTTGWIANGLYWYKNPGPKATMAGEQWKAEKITDTFDTEGGAFADINGDGKPDLALAHYNHSGVIWVDFSKSKPVVHKTGDQHQGRPRHRHRRHQWRRQARHPHTARLVPEHRRRQRQVAVAWRLGPR